MIIQDILLIVFVIVCLWIAALSKYKKLFFLLVLAALVHMVWSHMNLLLLITYLTAVIGAGMYLCRSRKRVTIAITGGLTVLTIVFLVWFSGMDSKCYMSYGYVEAFRALHGDIKQEYALADYKGIDLDALYEQYLPRITQAEAKKDEKQFLNALVDYANAFHDGHINVYDTLEVLGVGSAGTLNQAKTERFTSCYDVAFLKLDDGTYIAVNVVPEGVAYKAGIREGNQILSWNGQEITEAVGKLEDLIPVRSRVFADEENRALYRGFFLPCMSGEEATVGFVDETHTKQQVTMSSTGNGYSYLRSTIDMWSNRVNGGSLNSTQDKSVTYEIIPDKYCYIRMSSFGGSEEEMTAVMDQIAEEISAKHVEHVLIDVRNNAGGADELGAIATSYFAEEDMLYLKESHFEQESRTYVVDSKITVQARNKISLPVTLLINSQCISAGEGFVYNMAKLPQVTVVGMSGTNGSFGSFSGVHMMPELVCVIYPGIACLGEDNKVMIDSDVTGLGGIKPDIYIPVDEAAAKVMFTSDEDYELDYVINKVVCAE